MLNRALPPLSRASWWRRIATAAAIGATAGGLVAACSLQGLYDGQRDAGPAAGGAGASSGQGAQGNGGNGGNGGAPTCADGVTNGDETDLDCGGTCPACAVGLACARPTDCRTATCQAQRCGCPPEMVEGPVPSGVVGVPYCIDTTEVTNAAYYAFLVSNPDSADQPAECVGWNASFTPALWDPAIATVQPDHPVVNVDWCDARAYCRAQGKRLCGQLGGGPHSFDFPDAKTSEWFSACSDGGSQLFPYGDTPDGGACVGRLYSDAGPDAPQLEAVRSAAGCEGGYPALFDMNGNVWEWEDACDVGGGDPADVQCRRRGGSYRDNDPMNSNCLACKACGISRKPRKHKSSEDTGIRCCAG